MVDAIIILIVLVLLFFALKGSVKHFRGEGPCCGGGSGLVKTEKKTLDGPVVAVRRVRISGMHCENCAERVRRAIDSLDGAACDADAGTGIAIVRLDRSIDDIAIRKKIEEAGYTVDSIEQG